MCACVRGHACVHVCVCPCPVRGHECVLMCVYACALCGGMHVYTCVCTCPVWGHACVHVCVCVPCVGACMCTCVCARALCGGMHVYTCVCMRVHTHACVYNLLLLPWVSAQAQLSVERCSLHPQGSSSRDHSGRTDPVSKSRRQDDSGLFAKQ